MKKIALSFLVLALVSCGASSTKSSASKPVYEILTQQSDGGANIRFFEILSEEKEIRMLQSDENLKNKIRPEDTTKANFIILNMGEKPTGGYSITIDKVEETPTKIIITVKEKAPDPGDMTTQAVTNPYTIVKINSKKEIEIR